MRFFKYRTDPLLRAQVLAERSMQLVYDYAEQAARPLSDEDLEKIFHLVEIYHRNFISAEYVLRHQSHRAKRNEAMQHGELPVSMK